jgi:hypothetical protein
MHSNDLVDSFDLGAQDMASREHLQPCTPMNLDPHYSQTLTIGLTMSREETLHRRYWRPLKASASRKCRAPKAGI